MTEAQAQNKLGELFVDIGVGGLGKTLKALNSVSASFLLTKNAATQALKPIADMSKQGAALSVAYDKISAATGIGFEKIQEIRNWAKLNNVEFNGFIGTLQSLQQEILAFQKGTSTNGAWSILGINPSELNFEKPLEALEVIQSRLKQLKEPARVDALNMLGLPQDLSYSLMKNDTPLMKDIENAQKGILKLTQEEKQRLEEQNEAWNKFNLNWENGKNKLIANTDAVSVGLDYLNEKIIDTADGISGGLNWYTKKIAELGQIIGGVKVASRGNIVNYDNVIDKNGHKLTQKELLELQDKTNKMLEEEGRKYWEQNNGKKEEKQNPIVKELSKTDSAKIPQESNTEILGAKQINVPEVKQVKVTQELTDDNLPPLPKEAPLTNNVKTVNINNTFTNNFDGVNASPSDIADEIAAQVAQYSTVEKENPLIN